MEKKYFFKNNFLQKKLNAIPLVIFLLYGTLTSFAFENKYDPSVGSIATTKTAVVVPTLTSFAPTSACFNSGASVVITGSEFTGASSVTFNGVTASYVVDSDTQITATLPNTATTGLITIVTPTGTISSGSNFTVTALPVVSLPVVNLCVGLFITLSPTTGGTWVSNNPAVATVTNAGIATAVSPGSVTFTYTNTLTGCSATTNPLNVNPLPAAPPVPLSNGPQCASTGVTLTRNGSPAVNTNWFWQTTPTGTSTANSAITWTVFTTGTYYIRTRSAATGCWSPVTSINVVISPPATINLTSAPATNNQTTCLNSPITPITYGISNATGATVSGLPSGVTGSFSGGTFTISGSPSVTGTFTFTVTTVGGCSPDATATGTINVTALPVVSLPVTNLCVGLFITLSPTSGGTWISNNPAVATVTNAGVATAVSPGSVTFTYTNTLTGCSATTNPLNVNALPAAPPVPLSNGPQCASTGVTLTRNGSPAVNTNWFWQTTPTGTSTANSAITWTVFTTGTYYIRTRSAATGCWSPVTSINVVISPPATINLTSAPATNNQTTCLNSPITPITYGISNATGATVSGLPSGVTGSFSGGTFTISGSPSVAGTFTYTVTTVGGCSPDATATGTINVTALPVVSLPVTNLCVGLFITLSPTTGGTWISNNPAVATVTNAGVATAVSPGSVTFTYTNTLTGCSATTNPLNVNALPIAPPVPLSNGPQCVTTGVTLTRNGSPTVNTNWFWQTTPTGTSNANSALTWTVFTSGTYYIRTFSLLTGCWSPATSIDVVIIPLPAVTNLPTYTVCSNVNANIPLTATIPSNFVWVAASNPNVGGESTTNQTSSTISNILTNATNTVQTVVYTVTPTSITGACLGAPQTISVVVNPTATVNAIANQTYCNGVTATLPVFSSPQTPASNVTYSWTSSINVGFGTSGAGDVPIFTTTNAGTTILTSTVTVTPSFNGCPGTPRIFTLTVRPTPTVNPVANQTLCRGTNTATITLTSPVAGTTFTWTNNNTSIGLAASGSGSVISSFPSVNTTNIPQIATITVTPTANGCVGPTSTFTITVNPTPTVNAVANQTHCNGSTTSAINFAGNNVPGVVYNWTNNTPSIGLPATGSGNITPFVATNTGTSIITATITVTPSANGCLGTPRTFTIIVRPTPTVNAVANQVRCAGTSTAAINFTGAVTGTTYSWVNSNPAIGLAASGTGNIGPTSMINAGNTPIVATITVTPAANGCSGTPISFTITVNPIPTVNPIANISNICNGSLIPAVNFTGNNVPGVVYNWTNNNPSIGLPASGSGNIASFTAINTGTVLQTATITVTPNANGCAGFARTFQISIWPTPLVTPVADRVHCHNIGTITGVTFGTNVSVGGPATFAWTSTANVGFGTSGSGNIPNYNPQNLTNAPIVATVSVVCTRNGCAGPATTFTLTVNPRPTVDVIANQNLCNGEATTAINFTSPVAGTTFTWSYAGGTIGLPLSGSGNIPSFTAVNAGTADIISTFTVIPTFAGCAGATRTFTITVRPTPIVNVIANQTRCHDQGITGTGVNFGNNIPGGGTTLYTWTSTVDVGFGLSGSGNIPNYNPQNPGTTPIVTTVTVICTRNGCVSPARTFTITVNPKPIVTVLADYCAVGGKVQLIASSNLPGATWSWNTMPVQTTSTILVDIAGVYTANATVNGCSGSASIDIATELVVNGDFTDGNVGFLTDYMYLVDIPFVNNELIPDTGTRGYGVGTNANNYHPAFWGIDHTNNAIGPRNMMIVNGKGGSLTLWQQTVVVKPNTDYYFSGWGMSVNPSSPAILRFEVNGVQVGFTAALGAAPTNATQAAANNYWIRFYSTPTWNSGAISGPITIRIVNLNPALGGNDFAIDDISFGTLSTFVNLTSAVGSDNQALCRNTPISPITYSVGSGIAGPTITGLPPGVTSDWNGVTLRLSGTPTVSGTYTYTITTTGNCLPATASGTIIVQPSPEPPTTVTVTQPTCLVSTGTISVTSLNGIYYSIDGVNYSNVSGVFSGLAPGTYNITTRNNDNLCESLALTVVIVPQVINTWNGTTWSNGTPIITDTVVFNGNYNQSVNFQGCSCTVNSGDVVIPVGTTVTITNGVRVLGGSLTFENNSSLVQINNVANTGNITYKRTATNIQGQDYIYWSSPVVGQNLNTIYTTPSPGQKYIWNTTTNNGNGTGGNISQGNWEDVNNVTMQAARGYIVRGSNNFTMPATTINSTFIGVPRNGNISTSVQRGQYTGANYIGLNGIQITNLDDNWNLIGNPYPSAINALQFLSDNSGNILGNVRLWKHGIDISNLTTNPFYGSFGYNYSSSDYEIINFTGTTTPLATEIIKTGQAFFVQMIDGPGNAIGSVSFNNAQRSNIYANDNFFRVSAENSTDFNSTFTPERHRIWLDIVNSNNASTGTLVGYVAGATMGVDAKFDAYDKPMGDMRILSSIADNTYTIQGRSLPFNQEDIVPLVVVTPSTGVYNIAIRAVDGLFENASQNIYLEDVMLGTIHDLKANPYTFTSTPGTHASRFLLRYTNGTLNLPSFETNDNVFAYTDDNVWVKSIQNNIKNIVVYDLLGKKVDEYRNVDANEVKLKNLMPRKMVYILRITLENDVVVNKKIIF